MSIENLSYVIFGNSYDVTGDIAMTGNGNINCSLRSNIHNSSCYDDQGAMLYIVVMICIFAMGIVLLIAAQMSYRPEEENQVSLYLKHRSILKDIHMLQHRIKKWDHSNSRGSAGKCSLKQWHIQGVPQELIIDFPLGRMELSTSGYPLGGLHWAGWDIMKQHSMLPWGQ